MRCVRCGIGAYKSKDEVCELCVNIPHDLMRQIWMYLNVINFRADNPETSLQVMLAMMTLSEVCKAREEQRMSDATLQDQVTTLTSDVTALTGAFTDFETAVAAEIAGIKASPAAADPVIAQGLTNIETLTAKIKADTAAATPAPVVAPPVVTPTPVATAPVTATPADTVAPAPGQRDGGETVPTATTAP